MESVRRGREKLTSGLTLDEVLILLVSPEDPLGRFYSSRNHITLRIPIAMTHFLAISRFATNLTFITN